MIAMSPNKMYGSAIGRRACDMGSKTASQMSPEKTAACRNFCLT